MKTIDAFKKVLENGGKFNRKVGNSKIAMVGGESPLMSKVDDNGEVFWAVGDKWVNEKELIQ